MRPLVLAVLLALFIAPGSRARQAPGPIPLPADPEVELALSALPPHMQDGATVHASDVPWPTERWTRSDPEAEGLDPGPLARLDSLVRSGSTGLVDRLVVVRNARLVVDERYARDYFEASRGRESAIGCGWQGCAGDPSRIEDPYNYLHPSSHPYWHGSDLHSVQSVTKSVAATVLGAALHRGDLPGLDAPLLSYFRDRDLSRADPRLSTATLEDLLTMRTGIEWHETDRPLDETNTTLRLERSEDWIRFTLEQPMDAEPGVKWAYSSGGSHLMSGVIRSATGRFMDEYAREVLFGPLGIRSFHWKKTPSGYPDTEGGLYISATDLAKIGLLYLHDGTWDGTRILPEGWARTATAVHVPNTLSAAGYGYQWWRLDRDGIEIWAGQGFGENYLLVLPDYDVVAVVQSWNLFGAPSASIRNEAIAALIESVR